MSHPAPSERTAADEMVSTRERILRSAAVVLGTQGYAQAHLKQIALRAGVRPPAIYYYFESREDLISAVMREGQQFARHHVTAALEALPPDASAEERILAAVEAHLRVELELSEFATAVTRTARQLPAAIRAELDAESEAFHQIWIGLLTSAEQAHALRPDLDLTIARMLVIGALNWAAEWRDATTSVDAVVHTAKQLIASSLFREQQAIARPA